MPPPDTALAGRAPGVRSGTSTAAPSSQPRVDGPVSRETSSAPRSGPDVSRETAEIPRAPWSAIWPEFIRAWGYPAANGGEFDPEDIEILGPKGSGKTYLEATILQQRVRVRNSAVVFVATKMLDATIKRLGWPIVDTWKGVTRHRQVIFWPRTALIGEERDQYLERKIYDLLARLWATPGAVIVVFDEVAKVESLSSRMKACLQMWWREARSGGKTIVAMKQRPQGALRDMHSEAAWIASFKPKHQEDAEAVAMAMGSKRDWLPVLSGLNRDRREFVLYHATTGEAVISWVDMPLRPAVPVRRGLYRKGT